MNVSKKKRDIGGGKQRTLLIRLTESDYAKIFENAQAFASGNMSEWIRFAAKNLRMKKDGD